MNVVSIIGARGNSKSVPRKNIRMFAGKPLIAHTIEDSLNCKRIDRTIVSTEDEEIAKISADYGAEVPILRPPELSRDELAPDPAWKHMVEYIEEVEGYKIDIVLPLQPPHPFRPDNILERVIQHLLYDPHLDTCFVAKTTHDRYWVHQYGDWQRCQPFEGIIPRQDANLWHREDAGIAMATRSQFIKDGVRCGKKIHIIPMDLPEFWLDIHCEDSFWLSEQMFIRKYQNANY